MHTKETNHVHPQTIGCRVWAIPKDSFRALATVLEPEMTSHEAACLLNTSEKEGMTFTVYFSDREPAGPYQMIISPRWTFHLRLNEISITPNPFLETRNIRP